MKIENLSILAKIDGKYYRIPVKTTNQNMLIGALKILQCNPDISDTIMAIEIDETKFKVEELEM